RSRPEGLRRPRPRDDARGDLSRSGRRGDDVRGAVIVAGYAMRESVRRRVFPVVLVLTAAFLGLYGFGVYKAYQSIDPNGVESIGNGGLVDTRVLFSATLFGLSIFAVLFLGT